MRERRGFTVAAGLLTAAVVGSACEQPEATAVPDVGSPLFWVGCSTTDSALPTTVFAGSVVPLSWSGSGQVSTQA